MKLNLCMRYKKEAKGEIEIAVSNLHTLPKREEIDEIRAIYGAGSTILSPTYQKFKVQSHIWRPWTKVRKENHVTKFCNYQSTINHSFEKLSASGSRPIQGVKHVGDTDQALILS